MNDSDREMLNTRPVPVAHLDDDHDERGRATQEGLERVKTVLASDLPHLEVQAQRFRGGVGQISVYRPVTKDDLPKEP